MVVKPVCNRINVIAHLSLSLFSALAWLCTGMTSLGLHEVFPMFCFFYLIQNYAHQKIWFLSSQECHLIDYPLRYGKQASPYLCDYALQLHSYAYLSNQDGFTNRGAVHIYSTLQLIGHSHLQYQANKMTRNEKKDFKQNT